MAKEGAIVILANCNQDEVEQTAQQLRETGGQALAISADVSNEEHHERLVETALKEYGRIDILVNNAGIRIHRRQGSDREQVLRVFHTNFISPFFLTQQVARTMVRQKTEGSILFTTSTHAWITYLDQTYTATKAAIEMFIRDTALELAEYGIRVNGVAPRAIQTGTFERRQPFVPLGQKRGTPTDIGQAMVFLASSQASYITGHMLVVDGAFSLAHEAYWNNKQLLQPRD